MGYCPSEYYPDFYSPDTDEWMDCEMPGCGGSVHIGEFEELEDEDGLVLCGDCRRRDMDNYFMGGER